MNTARRLRRRTAWLALAALLWLAIAPTLSHALAAIDRAVAPWSAVCSADDGVAGRAAPVDAAQHLAEHCPYCALQPLSAVPPSPAAAWQPQARGHELPWLFLHAPTTLHAWRHALSRGPPAA